MSEDKNAFLGKDRFGNEWYSKMIGTKQLWVTVKNGIIQNGGLNEKEYPYIDGEGIKIKFIKRRK